jgi:hypothetical protein
MLEKNNNITDINNIQPTSFLTENDGNIKEFLDKVTIIKILIFRTRMKF